MDRGDDGKHGATGPDVRRIERLAVEMALTFNWISLYQAGHPSLAGRVEKFHRNLAEVVDGEPSGHLLLGVAKDKFLYQNVFLGNGNSLVRSFTSELFLQQVATLDFSKEVTPRELLTFFLSLQRIRVEKRGGKLDEILKAEGVRGIGLYPYNYKEVLSRRIIHPEWRCLLAEPGGRALADDPHGERVRRGRGRGSSRGFPDPSRVDPGHPAQGLRQRRRQGGPPGLRPGVRFRNDLSRNDPADPCPPRGHVAQALRRAEERGPPVPRRRSGGCGGRRRHRRDPGGRHRPVADGSRFGRRVPRPAGHPSGRGGEERKPDPEDLRGDRDRAEQGRFASSGGQGAGPRERPHEELLRPEGVGSHRGAAAAADRGGLPRTGPLRSPGEAVEPRSVGGRDGRRKPARRPGGHGGIRGGEHPPQGSRRPAGAARGRGGGGRFPGTARGSPEDHPQPDIPQGAPPPEDLARYPDVGEPERPGKQKAGHRARYRRGGFRPHDRPLPLARRFEDWKKDGSRRSSSPSSGRRSGTSSTGC